MFVPHTFGISLLMLTSAICWGSWANTYKRVKNYRFELFYWDYALGIFLIAVALAFTMGNTSNDASSFLNNIRTANRSNFIYTLAGGAVFNLANLLLVAAIDMGRSGHCFSGFDRNCDGNRRGFKLCAATEGECGIARSWGRLRRYRGDPRWQGSRKPDESQPVRLPEEHRDLRHFRNPDGPLGSVRHSRDDQGNTLGPYSIGVFFTLGALLSCLLWNVYFMKNPLVAEPVNFGEFFHGPASGHMLGLMGGVIWGTGTVFNLVAANFTGVAISYAIGQSAPMVAALWGVFAWKEFEGSNRQAKTFLGLMFLFYVFAILLIAKANTAG